MAAALLQIDLVFSRPQTTLAVTRGAARLMVDLGYAPLLEVGLPNGRRADVMALGPRGEIAICEVKSGLEDFRVDRKWGEYGPFCDAFYFAVAPEFPAELISDDCGLIVAILLLEGNELGGLEGVNLALRPDRARERPAVPGPALPANVGPARRGLPVKARDDAAATRRA